MLLVFDHLEEEEVFFPMVSPLVSQSLSGPGTLSSWIYKLDSMRGALKVRRDERIVVEGVEGRVNVFKIHCMQFKN